MYNALNSEEILNPALENTVVDEEEFFERTLFDDVLELKSLQQVSEMTATDLKILQDKAYQNLFNLYQETRGIHDRTTHDSDEIFTIFELFFKNYYQHFRQAMEKIIAEKSPVRAAYCLGKSSDKIISMLDQIICEIEKELN